LAVEDSSGGVLGVDGVGLAAQPAVAPVGPEHLKDADIAAAIADANPAPYEPVPSTPKIT
jgi:hypothetical protein